MSEASAQDRQYLLRALALAGQAGADTSPNPKVGCVLVADGRVIGEGWTQPVGQAHAEVQALRDAAARGIDPRGATAYVTLEPCSHFGRTPPCANALVQAGVARVVAALGDANPLVAGKGFAILRAAGIAVSCAEQTDGWQDIALAAREMNIGFFRRMESGLPWMRMKLAASLDGRTALPNGQSQWITGPAARADGHHWRARADAILTGIGTVLHDDPQMTVRAIETPRQPHRVVLDSHLRTPPDAQILKGGGTLIICAEETADRRQALQQAGAEVLCLPNPAGQVDLAAVVRELGRRQYNEVHVEAGAGVNGGLFQAGLIDEILLYLAPRVLGQGAGLMSLPELSSVDQSELWQWHQWQLLDDDLRLLLRRKA